MGDGAVGAGVDVGGVDGGITAGFSGADVSVEVPAPALVAENAPPADQAVIAPEVLPVEVAVPSAAEMPRPETGESILPPVEETWITVPDPKVAWRTRVPVL